MPHPFFKLTPREAFERTAVMAGKRLVLICTFILSLLVVAGVWAQAPSIPPDIQAIFDKAKSGQAPTAAESKRLQEWGQSMSAAASGGGANNANAASAGAAPAVGVQGQKPPCPPAHASLVTAAAPTRAEYIVLVKSLVETYGRKLGTHRAEFDHIFAKPGATSTASQAGPVLFISGAAGASVYASAVAAMANPDDLQVASNLGVALDSIPDAKAATAVLLYAHKLAPQQAMPALNLAWVYFNSGHATEAKTLFQNAALLDPDLSGPPAGLGMLASCQGDTATAMSMFRKSLSKSYSGVVAAGYTQAQKQEEQQQQQQSSTEPPPSFPPSGSDDSSPLPDLPATTDPQATLGNVPAFQQAIIYADTETKAATARALDAGNRVLAIIRHSQIDPDGTINLPRTFDKQLFEYGQIVKLTVGASMQGNIQPTEAAFQPMLAATKQMSDQVKAEMPHLEELSKEHEAALAAGDQVRAAELQYQVDQITFRWCKLTKQTLEIDYAQHFKVYKLFSDSSRASSRDLYAYSQPIIDQIWVPSLNDWVQASRELYVLIPYGTSARYANSLAEVARGINNLKCVEPQPPKPPKTIKNPTLTKKKPDCPLNPPLSLDLVVAKLELGCEKVKISGGEILRVEVERNFVTKSTAVWVGVGLTASLPSVSLGGGCLGDNGKSWSPPSLPAGAEANAQMMLGVTFNGAGAVDDVAVKSTVQASGNIGTLSGTVGVSSGLSLENGPSLTPILNGKL
jgi:tetratricopeptide (TPR) repeat protein